MFINMPHNEKKILEEYDMEYRLLKFACFQRTWLLLLLDTHAKCAGAETIPSPGLFHEDAHIRIEMSKCPTP